MYGIGVREELMITCDLCGRAKECLQKEIDGREYDLCTECWDLLAQRLKGKGREKLRETVLLPPRPAREQKEEEPHTLPGGPPIIQGTVCAL
jgi:ribosome-binding protein aMBF1 (putative translation factor)